MEPTYAITHTLLFMEPYRFMEKVYAAGIAAELSISTGTKGEDFWYNDV